VRKGLRGKNIRNRGPTKGPIDRAKPPPPGPKKLCGTQNSLFSRGTAVGGTAERNGKRSRGPIKPRQHSSEDAKKPPWRRDQKGRGTE